MSLIDDLRTSRKSPIVLRLRLLKIRGEDPDVLVFFYEGPDDIPVYEEWIRRVASCPRYEPVIGSGKQQLLAYHKQLQDATDPALDKIYFFVDRDFDLPLLPSDHVFELEAYSIENLICTEEVFESILKDEFRLAGSIAERGRLKAKFAEIRRQFLECCDPINFLLFVAQRTARPVLAKPEKVVEIASIEVDAIGVAYQVVSDVVAIAPPHPDEEELAKLKEEFEALDYVLRQRGKYFLEMFRRWLRALAADIRSAVPKLFSERDERLPGDPSTVSLRRLASSAPIPPELSLFIGKISERSVANRHPA